MKRQTLVIGLIAALVFSACKTVYVPVHTVETVTVRDTTYLHRVDTLVQVPEFHLADYASLGDTLRMRSSVATATAWLDTTTMSLKGRLDQTGKIPVKIVEKERIVYKDSIRDREVPVPVEVEKKVKVVPWYARILSGIGVIALLILAGWIAFKFLLKR